MRAIADFDRVIDLKPDYATAYNDRANACACLGRFDAALRDYNRAIEADPGYATARFNRANIRAGEGRLEEAIQDYSRAIALKPSYADAYNNRAVAYYDLKEFSKAWADVKMSEKLGGRPNAGIPESPGARRRAAGIAEHARIPGPTSDRIGSRPPPSLQLGPGRDPPGQPWRRL